MAPSERILRLLSLLQQRRDWSGEDLADRLGVSARTVRRDVDRLRSLGYPVDGDRGVAGGYRLAPGAVLPPLVLDDEEAVALVVALRLATSDATVATGDAAVAALAKVVQVLPPRLRRRADDVAATVTVSGPWSSSAVAIDSNVLVVLATAARNGERVEFTYERRGGDISDRSVEPVQVVVHAHRWYLVAYDTDRLDWRTFRVDRVSEPRPTGRRYVPKSVPFDDAAEYVRQSVRQQGRPIEIELELATSADVVNSRFGRWVTASAIGPEHCSCHMTVDSFDWPTFMIAQLGVAVTVRAPVAFREHLVDTSRLLAGAAE